MDLYIVYGMNLGEEALMLKEIIEYTLEVIERDYGLTVDYQVIRDDSAPYPYLLVNDMGPIYLDKIPDVESLVKMMLVAAGDTGEVIEGFKTHSFLVF
jgi:hypothetical protein